MKSDRDKAAEILAKRRIAAKGLKEREDGKAVDPVEGMTSLDADDKRPSVDPTEAPAPNIPAAAALGRSR